MAGGKEIAQGRKFMASGTSRVQEVSTKALPC